MKQSVPKSIDEYIAAQPEAVRPKLEQVRAAIRRAVPEAVEGIGYRMPGYKLQGKPMLYFAAFKEHYSLFAASGDRIASPLGERFQRQWRASGIECPDTSCRESRCCISPLSRNTIRCLPHRGRSLRRSKMSSGAMSCERGRSISHSPNRFR